MPLELCMNTECLWAPVTDVVSEILVHPFDMAFQLVLVRKGLFAHGARMAGPVSVHFVHVRLQAVGCLEGAVAVSALVVHVDPVDAVHVLAQPKLVSELFGALLAFDLLPC